MFGLLKISLFIVVLFIWALLQPVGSKPLAPKGDTVIANGFCLYYAETKKLVDILATRNELKTMNYFRSKDNSCYHVKTHPLKPFPLIIEHRLGYTAYSNYWMGKQKVRIGIWAGRAPDGTMVYVWFYVEEEKV